MKIWVGEEEDTAPPGYSLMWSFDDIVYYIRERNLHEISIQMKVGRSDQGNDRRNAIGILHAIEDMAFRYNDFTVPLMFCHEAENRDRENIEKKIVQLLRIAKNMGRRIRRGA